MIGDVTGLKKQLQAELATAIYECYTKGRLSSPELLFLLQMLEDVIEGRAEESLFAHLRRWVAAGMHGPGNQEINEIIKATLISTDWKEPASRQNSTEIIAELVEELEKAKKG